MEILPFTHRKCILGGFSVTKLQILLPLHCFGQQLKPWLKGLILSHCSVITVPLLLRRNFSIKQDLFQPVAPLVYTYGGQTHNAEWNNESYLNESNVCLPGTLYYVFSSMSCLLHTYPICHLAHNHIQILFALAAPFYEYIHPGGKEINFLPHPKGA